MLASLCYLLFCDARYQIVLIVAPLTILLSFSARNQRVPARALAQPQNLSRHGGLKHERPRQRYACIPDATQPQEVRPNRANACAIGFGS